MAKMLTTLCVVPKTSSLPASDLIDSTVLKVPRDSYRAQWQDQAQMLYLPFADSISLMHTVNTDKIHPQLCFSEPPSPTLKMSYSFSEL